MKIPHHHRLKPLTRVRANPPAGRCGANPSVRRWLRLALTVWLATWSVVLVAEPDAAAPPAAAPGQPGPADAAVPTPAVPPANPLPEPAPVAGAAGADPVVPVPAAGPAPNAAPAGKKRTLPVPLPADAEVLIIPLRREIDSSCLFAVRRGFQRVRKDRRYVAVVLDMDTPGGSLADTREIIDWVLSANVPVYVFVNTQAASAGAIISLATDDIYMKPGSMIGAATPIMLNPGGGLVNVSPDVAEKMKSYTRGMVRAVAQEKGYLPELAEAMVDKDLGLKIGDQVVCPKGQLLTLTAADAVKVIPPRTQPLLAKALANGMDDVLKATGLDQAAVVELRAGGGAMVADWIVRFSFVLLLGGIIGLYIELKTPGFGLPGVIGIICLGLFFFGHYLAGLAGATEAILLILGIILVIVEIFLIPGFGIVGVTGIVCVIVGIVMAMIPSLPGVRGVPGLAPVLTLEPFLQRAVICLFATMLACGVIGFLLARYLPKTHLYGKAVLVHSASAEAGFVGVAVAENRSLMGEEGEALSDLRPAGIARIAGKRRDVVSRGDYIPQGARVRVVEVNGPRIAVVEVPAAPAPGKDTTA